MRKRYMMTAACLALTAAVAWAGPYKAEHPMSSGGNFWTLNATGYTDAVWKNAGDFECQNSNADIDGAEWWMASRGGATLADITSFDLSIYADTGSGPGALLQTSTITTFGADFVQTVSWGGGEPAGEVRKFSGVIDPVFDQTEGTVYWFSAVANVNEASSWGGAWRTVEGEAWGQWQYADRPDDEPTGWLTYADWSPDYEFDMAFNMTPEPATLTLAALGGLGLFARRRRK